MRTVNQHANTKMKRILELAEKDFKAATIKMLQQAIMHMFEANEKHRQSQKRNRKSQQRNRKYEKNQMEVLELKME